ncbi:MAG: hypothetical protein Q9227_007212 [Pyrenula ochraceoflavens]
MGGAAVGFLVGGILADRFTILTPFQVTLGLFLASTVYVLLALPYIPPEKEDKAATKGQVWYARAFGPLRSIMPAKWVLGDGTIRIERGPTFLAAGVCLAVLATGYIPTLLQASLKFGFGPKRNSYLVSMHAFLRGLFLIFVFPRIIAAGRYALEKRSLHKEQQQQQDGSRAATPIGPGPPVPAMQEDEEQDVLPPKPDDEEQVFEFDLIFTRFSLLIDGALTLGASFVKEGWQMYLVAALLPFGAGTASAAKGVILQMCPTTERTDALSAIALVEMIARLSTTFLFGLIYSAFADLGRAYLVFTCNAAVALVGCGVLLVARFPPVGSTRVGVVKKGGGGDEEDGEDGEENGRARGA